MGEPLDLFAKPVGIKLFDCIQDARMDVTAPFAERPVVGDVVGERMLKSVSQVGKALCRVDKLGCLEIVEQAAKPVLGQPANCMQEDEWDIVPITAASCSRRF